MARAQLAALLLCFLFASMIVLSSCDGKEEATKESTKGETAESKNYGHGGYGYGHGGNGHGHGGYGHGGYSKARYGHGHEGYGHGH
ncbi:hypothetical protein KP509_14G044900 [Ceratopteris richardii]|uniref:Uncharacterized protein n=1 Tax=Ceratopteris richardii TaxID=49495 RepID=A0A8T2T9E1_CERRI|nr:hypothetical protein KP509_14G044900 [Ceratopteris richardii]